MPAKSQFQLGAWHWDPPVLVAGDLSADPRRSSTAVGKIWNRWWHSGNDFFCFFSTRYYGVAGLGSLAWLQQSRLWSSGLQGVFFFLNIAAHDACSIFALYRFSRVYLTSLKDEDRLTQTVIIRGNSKFPGRMDRGENENAARRRACKTRSLLQLMPFQILPSSAYLMPCY